METGELETAFELFKETLNKYDCQKVAMAYVLPGGGIKLEFRSKETDTEGTVVIERNTESTSFLILFYGKTLLEKQTSPYALTVEQINAALDSILNNIRTLLL